MRRGCSPSLIDEDKKNVSLNRILFSDRQIAEGYLQEILAANPDLLPVSEIDMAFAPLVSLGREIDSIDNLFISPSGRLTLVETKLWRNPEATREVVAQILDYAIRLSRRSYSELEKMVLGAPFGSFGKYTKIYDKVSNTYPSEVLPQEDFIDEVQKTLKNGRFLLLVVGDGIRENIESMVAPLHRFPQLLFTFGLVELQIYESPSLPGKRLIVPQMLANSQEIVRAVVRVQTTGEARINIEMESETERDEGISARRRVLTEDEFFGSITNQGSKDIFRRMMDSAKEIGAIPVWRSISVSLQLPDPRGSRQNLTLFVITTAGEVYLGWLTEQLERIGLDPKLGIEFVIKIGALFGVTNKRNMPDSLARNLTAVEVNQRYDDFFEIIGSFVADVKVKCEDIQAKN